MGPNYYFIIIAVIAVYIILRTAIKGKLPIEESFFWFVGSAIILGLAVYPKIIDKVAVRFGVDYPPSLFFVGCIIFLILINLRLNKKISVIQEKTIRLGQEVAILKAKKGKQQK